MSYIMQRFEGEKKSKAYNSILHNLRKVELNYLRGDLFHNNFNNTYIDKDFNIIPITPENINAILREMKQQLKEELLNQKLNNRNYREKKHSLMMSSVIAPSNSIGKKLEEGTVSKEKLEEMFLKTIIENTRQLGLEMLCCTIHYDETTPHAHVTYKNYDKNNKSILKKLTDNYSLSQDIAGNVWNEIGYVRGEKKEIKPKHDDIRKSHQKEIEQLENRIKELQKKEYQLSVQGQIEEYKKRYEALKQKYKEGIDPLIEYGTKLEKENKELKEKLTKYEVDEFEELAASIESKTKTTTKTQGKR